MDGTNSGLHEKNCAVENSTHYVRNSVNNFGNLILYTELLSLSIPLMKVQWLRMNMEHRNKLYFSYNFDRLISLL
jgi:hypothetical protein